MNKSQKQTKYNFDEIINRRGTASFKWDDAQNIIRSGLTERFDEDTIPLFTADMDIAVPAPVTQAMHRVADRRIYGYTIAEPEYFKAVKNWFGRRHSLDIHSEDIVFCPGTVHALDSIVKAFTRPGDGVIIQRPVYYPFTDLIEDNGRKVVSNQLIPDDDLYYRVNLDDFESLAKRPENTLFILCNPHNPTGRIFRTDVLKELSRICRDNGVLIAADEIHGDLIRQDQIFVPIAKAAESTGHIISCTAANKTFNLAGLHASNIIISNSDLKKRFKKTLGSYVLPSPFTCAAVIAAYNECEDWLEELKIYLDGNISWLMNFLTENMPKVRFSRPEGSYVFWMDFRDYGMSPEEIHDLIYIKANVVLEPGRIFDPDRGAGFERVCLSSPRSLIQKAFDRIAGEFAGLQI